MKRRDFLAMGVTMTGALAARAVLAQGEISRVRAAVVIGVDRAGHLPKLNGATSGARMVAGWLQSEGFEVKLFVDTVNPVKAEDIFDAIAALVDRGTLDQLVVYFSGHGFISGYSEYWMLSKAPGNPNEAVSFRESVELAKESAIPNVVFISDACRSRSDSLGTERVRGSLIFPNRGVSTGVRADVDLFLATLVGEPSFELPVADSVAKFEGIYTASFLNAFQHPDKTMVRTLNDIQVVPNNKLKPYLLREVRARAEAKSIRLSQLPDTQVVSGEDTYIARVAGSVQLPPDGPLVAPTIQDLARVELSRVGLRSLDVVDPGSSAMAIATLATETGFASARDAILDATTQGPGRFETQTGFAVSGARLELAVGNLAMRTELLTPGGGPGQTALVRVDTRGTHAGSVALRFTGGSGTVIAALDGYIGNVVVDAQGVSNVSYVPSQNNSRFSDYAYQRKHLDDLHAVIATAARFGVFRIEGERETRTKAAAQLADRIRIMKGIDPTLGLYAAYAYADAGLMNQVRSVRDYMRGDLQADLFDVAMLSGSLSGKGPDQYDRTVPFCPMLSQGWGLLRLKDVRLPPAVDTARDHLRGALWTTFDAEGMGALISALQEGRLR